MQFPNNDPPLCASCQEKAAIKQYTHETRSEMLCATCFDRWSVHDAFENELRHIFELEGRLQYDEALARLDAILEAERERDHDGWLAGSVAHHRAELLLEACRYAEAEQAYDAWSRLGFIDIWRRRMHALGLARTLEGLGREREAVAVLEDVLGYDDPKDVPFAIHPLAELARLSEKLHLPVDSKWLRIAEGVAERYGVDMPVRDSPGEAILALEEITQGRQPKPPDE